MPLTYTYAADLSDARDWVRFRIGDTDMTAGVPLVSDEEIDALLPGGAAAKASNLAAAIAICDALVARFSRAVDASEGSASASMSQLAAQYRQLGRDLRSEAVTAINPAASFTGASIGTALDPAFTRRMGDPDRNVPTPESELEEDE